MRSKFLFVLIFSASIGFAQKEAPAYHFNIDNFPDIYGGKPEWKRFLHDHMVYPPAELAKKIEGTVQILFIVTEDGKGVNPRITKSVSEAIDKEALRLFRMLEWFSATKDGKAVNVDNSIEINFSVSKYKKWVKEREFIDEADARLPSDTSFAIYESADKGPTFYNTEKTFSDFVFSNTEYPEMAKKQSLEGYVVMSFIVEPDGHVSNIRVKSGIGGGCNEEAIRIMGLTTWKPAIKNGKYVRFRMYYTMSFSLKNSFKDNSSGSQRTWGQ